MSIDFQQTEIFLRENGISDEIINNFRNNCVTLEMAKELNDQYLKDLCPLIGSRIKLKKILQDYLMSQEDTSSCASLDTNLSSQPDSQDIDNIAVTLFQHRSDFPDFDLKTLLSTSPVGKAVLNYYNGCGSLDNKTDVTIKHLYTRIVNCRITHEEYNLLAAKIVSLFPTENIGTYFVKPIKKADSKNGKPVFARGKLVDKVRNLLYASGERKRKSSCSSDISSSNQVSSSFENLNTLSQDDESKLIWLKTNIEPWDEVLKLWKKTYEVRRKVECTNIHDFLNRFKILQYQKCEELINYDFEKLYPNKSMSFYQKWPEVFDKIFNLKQKEALDHHCLTLIELLKTITDEDKKLPLQMIIFGHLVPPKGRLNRKIKFSTIESIEGLVAHVKTAGDIELKIEEQKQKAIAKKLTVQPYILIVGSLSNWTNMFIVVDTIKYQFTSAFNAFDLLLKLYHEGIVEIQGVKFLINTAQVN